MSENFLDINLSYPKMDKCPICLDDDIKGMFKLSCGHHIHEECAKGLCDIICPLCRKEINNFPKPIQLIVLKNKMSRREEMIQEAEEAILHEREEVNIEREIEIARSLLIRAGVPENIIPTLEIDLGNFPLTRGVVFRLIITNALSYYEDIMVSFMLHGSDSESSFSTESDEE